MPEALSRKLLFFSVIGASFLAPIVWRFYWPAGGVFDIIGYHLGRDFINVWTGPQVVARYGVMMLFDLTGYHWAQSQIFGTLIYLHNWGYPLFILFFAYPLSLLPYIPALIVWTVLGFAAYASAVIPRLAPEQRWIGFLFLLVSASSLVNIVAGQNGFITAALLLGGLGLLDRRPWIAGILFGILTYKPHLGVLVAVVLLVSGAGRSIVAASLTSIFLIGASIVAWGIEPWVTFLTQTSAYQYRLLVNFSGFYTFMMVSPFASMRLMGVPIDAAKIAQALISIGVIVTVMLSFRKTSDVGLRALLVASGTLLVSPYAFNYDMPMLTGALLMVMAARPDISRAETWIFGAAWVAPAAVWSLHLAGLGIMPLAYGGVFIVAVTMIYRDARVNSRSLAEAPQAA